MMRRLSERVTQVGSMVGEGVELGLEYMVVVATLEKGKKLFAVNLWVYSLFTDFRIMFTLRHQNKRNCRQKVDLIFRFVRRL
jgi:hypothetical protein